MPKAVHLAGQRFGSLVVQQEFERRPCNEGPSKPNAVRIFWRCLCDCGNETWARVHYLRSGHKKSCGCLFAKGYLPHGQAEMRARYRSYSAGALKRGIEWGLTLAQFTVTATAPCYYCGTVPPYKKFRERNGRW